MTFSETQAQARREWQRVWLGAGASATATGVLGSVFSLGVPLTASCALVSGVLGSVMVYRSSSFPASRRLAQGARGERRTAKILNTLRREGWMVYHDRSLPGTRANLDHLLLHPSGTFAVNADTKAWHAQNAPVHLEGRALMYGPWNQDRTVDTVTFESKRAARALGVPVVSVLVLDGARIDPRRHPSREITVPGAFPPFHVYEQADVLSALRAIPGDPDRARLSKLSRRAEQALPAYRRH